MNVQKLLQLTPEIYELMIFSRYLGWCNSHSASEEELQKLVASQALYDWFLVQYQKLEADFLNDLKPYAQMATQRDALSFYETNVRKMYLYFSTPLIEAVKKGT